MIEDHAGSYELRARVYETAGQLKEAIADLAIAQLLVSLKAGHPNPAEVAASEKFAPLTMLDSWKAVTECVSVAKP